jgi:hypothetical protein
MTTTQKLGLVFELVRLIGDAEEVDAWAPPRKDWSDQTDSTF